MLSNPTRQLLILKLQKSLEILFLFGCFLHSPWYVTAQTSPLQNARISNVDTASQSDTLCEKYFFKRLQVQDQAYGYQIVPAPNGNFYIASALNAKTMIALVDKDMEILWARSVELATGSEYINDMRLDSEGQIIGVGNATSAPPQSFAFKINSLNGQLIWLGQLNNPDNSDFTRILENSNASNYMVFGQTAFSIPSSTGCEALLMEVNRNTGELNWDKQYHLGSCETIYDVIIEGNHTYVCGRYSLHGGDQSGDRAVLSAFDSLGNFQWSHHYLRAVNEDAQIYASSMVREGKGFTVFGWGDDQGISLSGTALQLMSTDSMGAILWAKKYEIVGGSWERAFQILSLPDGYLLCGNYQSPDPLLGSEMYIIKTEKDGDFLWGKSYGGPGDDRMADFIQQSDTLYLIGRSKIGFFSDMIIGKLDLNGNVNGQCSYINDLEVAVSDYINPLDETHTLVPIGNQHDYGIVTMLSAPTDEIIKTELICETPCDTCLDVQISQNIEFCMGDSVLIGGIFYTQPGTVFDTIPIIGSDCDTIVTYKLQFHQSTFLNIQCPANVTVQTALGASSAIVNYNAPTATTDCLCGDVDIELQQGLASGSNFPVGITQVCLEASNGCGASSSCCLTVTVQTPPLEDACDVKTTPCVKFEILGIFQNPSGKKTYRMRVTNTCTNKLIYTAFQLPDGIPADNPANNALYTAPSGRQYEVRNPNASPIHSIRFKAIGDGIASGQSDIFEYTLPPQVTPLFINAMARLSPNLMYETHLNVFDCVVQQISNPQAERDDDRQTVDKVHQNSMLIFPNPASDMLFVQMPESSNLAVKIRIIDTYGRPQYHQSAASETNLLKLELPAELPAGCYFIEAVSGSGARYSARFIRILKP